MTNTFSDLITGHGFERHYARHFKELPDKGIDYRHVYSQPDSNPFLKIDFDNRQIMARITLWESGDCSLEVISFKNGAVMIDEAFKLSMLSEFEEKLVWLIGHMEATSNPH